MTESDQLTLTIAALPPNQIQQHGCHKNFNGLDGEYGKSASLWLAHMERHRERGSSPSEYLVHLVVHLEGEAAYWAVTIPNVKALIHKGCWRLATESDIGAFQRALRDRFKLSFLEASANPNGHYVEGNQGNTDMKQWYEQSRELLLSLHGRDGYDEILTPQEISLRDIVIRRFIIGLSSERLQGWLLQQRIYDLSISLYEAFRMAEEGTAATVVETLIGGQ